MDPALEDGPGYSAPCIPDSFKSYQCWCPCTAKKVPEHAEEPTYSSLPYKIPNTLAQRFHSRPRLSLKHHLQWRAALGIPWLACVRLRTFPTEFVSSHTETLVPLYSQGTHSGNLTFLFRNKCAFYRDPPRSLSQGSRSQLPQAPAAGLPPSCPLLSTWEFEKWGEKIILCDLTLPMISRMAVWVYKWPSHKEQLPAKGFWMLFYLHTEQRPGTAASPNTDPSGLLQFDWLSFKSHQTLMLWQESDLEYVDNPGFAVEISHLFWIWELLTEVTKNARICTWMGKWVFTEWHSNLPEPLSCYQNNQNCKACVK